MRRVVITGMSPACSLGSDHEELFSNLCDKKQVLKKIEKDTPCKSKIRASYCVPFPDLEVNNKFADKLRQVKTKGSKSSYAAAKCALMAADDAGLEKVDDNTTVFVGSDTCSMEELTDQITGICPVGCSVMAYDYFAFDVIEAPHGRAPAVATGVKRALPDRFVFTYQGDGDLAAIGTAETVHSATRGENIVVIFVNNTIYGMTGGQMAPTTIPGQVTQTTPYGRDPKTAGFPVKICEMLSALDGVALAQRTSVDSVAHIRETKKAIQKAFDNQKNNRGFSIVEILSTCPTNWGLDPAESMERLRKEVIPYFPLGVYKDITAQEDKDE